MRPLPKAAGFTCISEGRGVPAEPTLLLPQAQVGEVQQETGWAGASGRSSSGSSAASSVLSLGLLGN